MSRDNACKPLGTICGIDVEHGGWYDGPKLRKEELEAAYKRWMVRLYALDSGNPNDEHRGYAHWFAEQCGGCKWFLAWDSDFGFCCQEKSPNDGKVVFEHVGCAEHSELVRRNRESE